LEEALAVRSRHKSPARSKPRKTPVLLLEELEKLEAEVVHGLIRRFRLASLFHYFPARWVWSLFVFVNCFITISLLAWIAKISGVPFIFPSLGPSAFLFFFHPKIHQSTPRNAILGHAIGIFCGYLALVVTGLSHAPSAMLEGVQGARVLAVGISLSLTGALMALWRIPHPPAGATTLIISLGILSRPFHLFILQCAVIILALYATVINRVAGLDYPFWRRINKK
jgi:CBS-domain-containing membrane protein